jgi:hypothetical protein
MVAAPHPAHVTGTSAVPLDFTRILQYLAVNKDAVPQQSSARRWLRQIIQPAKTSPSFYKPWSFT